MKYNPERRVLNLKFFTYTTNCTSCHVLSCSHYQIVFGIIPIPENSASDISKKIEANNFNHLNIQLCTYLWYDKICFQRLAVFD